MDRRPQWAHAAKDHCALTKDQKAAGPIMATMAVADQPAANNSRRETKCGGEASNSHRSS